MMRRMVGTILNVPKLYVDYGIFIFIAMIVPVCWSQDINFKNNGYDIITLGTGKTGYFTGTYWEWVRSHQ
jgi:hypothetical protein